MKAWSAVRSRTPREAEGYAEGLRTQRSSRRPLPCHSAENKGGEPLRLHLQNDAVFTVAASTSWSKTSVTSVNLRGFALSQPGG